MNVKREIISIVDDDDDDDGSVLERQSKELFFQKKFLPSLHPGPRSEED